MSGFSLGHLKVLSTVPRISGVLSFLGSSWIIVEVLFDPKKLKNGCHQILLGMSVYDVMESAWNVAATAPIPEGTEGVYGAAGTVKTCEAQGFFLQFGVGIPIYNACLSIYYFLVIAQNYKEERLRRAVIPAMHVTAFLVAICTATAAIPLKLYNNANLWCWLAALPQGCDEGEDLECERGDDAWIYQIVFWYIPVLGAMFVSLVCTVLVYLSVRKREIASSSYRNPQLSRVNWATPRPSTLSSESGDETLGTSSYVTRSWRALSSKFKGGGSTASGTARENNQPLNPRTREVFEQSFWFTMAFWITHFLCSAKLTRRDTFPFWVVLLMGIFDPLQGFLNFLVYRRPRYLNHLKRLRKQNHDGKCWPTRLQALALTLRWSFLGDPVSGRSRYEGNQTWLTRMGWGVRKSLPSADAASHKDSGDGAADALDPISGQTQAVIKHQESSAIDIGDDNDKTPDNPSRTSFVEDGVQKECP